MSLYAVVDPATGEVVKEYPTATDEQMEQALAAAAKAYREWSKTSTLADRVELIRKVAENYKVRFEKVREPGAAPENYVVDHTAGMYLLGPDGRFLAKFAYAMPVSELTRRINDYLKSAP